MNAFKSSGQRSREGGASPHVYRFVILLARMTVGIGILVVIEATMLWRLGIKYTPRMSVQSVSVSEFAVDDSGRWAASRLAYVRSGHKQRVQNEVLLHDMDAPGEARRLDVPGEPRQMAIATDVGRIAIACYDGRIYIAPSMQRPEPLQLLATVPSGEVTHLACSADGQYVAAVDSNFLYLWRLAGRTLLHRCDLPRGAIAALAFSDNARHALICTVAGKVAVWDVNHGFVSKTFQTSFDIHEATFSPLGETITLIAIDGEVWQYDAGAEGTAKHKLTTDQCAVGAVAFSRDGSKIAVLSQRGDLRYFIAIWDTETGQQTAELQIGPSIIKGLRFAADDALYGWDYKGMIQRWQADGQRDRWTFCPLQWARSGLP